MDVLPPTSTTLSEISLYCNTKKIATNQEAVVPGAGADGAVGDVAGQKPGEVLGLRGQVEPIRVDQIGRAHV